VNTHLVDLCHDTNGLECIRNVLISFLLERVCIVLMVPREWSRQDGRTACTTTTVPVGYVGQSWLTRITLSPCKPRESEQGHVATT